MMKNSHLLMLNKKEKWCAVKRVAVTLHFKQAILPGLVPIDKSVSGVARLH